MRPQCRWKITIFGHKMVNDVVGKLAAPNIIISRAVGGRFKWYLVGRRRITCRSRWDQIRNWKKNSNMTAACFRNRKYLISTVEWCRKIANKCLKDLPFYNSVLGPSLNDTYEQQKLISSAQGLGIEWELHTISTGTFLKFIHAQTPGYKNRTYA